jgi:hypothetical protein
MTVPKDKGYRGIVVANRRFNWRFAERIVVVPDGLSGRQVLEVDFGWFDEWLHVNDANRPPAFSPSVATPAFVASAIEFALRNGWSTDIRGGRFLVTYSAEKGFQIASVDTQNRPVVDTSKPAS